MFDKELLETTINKVLRDEKLLRQTDTVKVVDVDPATTPSSYNKTMTEANKVYEIPIPAGTRYFTVRCRSSLYAWFYSWQPDMTNYSTVPAAGEYYEPAGGASLKIPLGTKLYVQCATAAQVLECTFWR